mmetsp:Transcript_46/g.53  ORF Transcript_46/g.53 Transcript_46/m.53 type:complete len:146 (-) Transcript_46:10-447(-)
MRTTERHVLAAWRCCFALPDEAGGVFLYAFFAEASRALSLGPRFMRDNVDVASSTAISELEVAFVALISKAADAEVYASGKILALSTTMRLRDDEDILLFLYTVEYAFGVTNADDNEANAKSVRRSDTRFFAMVVFAMVTETNTE